MLRQINIKPEDKADIYKGSRTYGCGRINNDDFLYLIDKENSCALQLPEKYKDTPLILYHDCGGYQDGLIMVSLLPMDLPLQYHHEFADAAGLWGWIDLEGNEVIPPQYVYALSFEDGLAIVCAGSWDVSDGEYWCNNERWGAIDHTGAPVIPLQYEGVCRIEDTSRYYLCHRISDDINSDCIYDIEEGREIADCHFYYDGGYYGNSVFIDQECIIFQFSDVYDGTPYISIYDTEQHRWLLDRADLTHTHNVRLEGTGANRHAIWDED